MALQYLTCSKCGRTLKETDFFKMKSGNRCELCKDCLCQYVDNRNPDTFLWILKKFDVPYIEKKWVELTNKIYLKDPSKFGPRSVIGSYLRTMNMNQYRDFHFEDTEEINNPNRNVNKDAPREEVVQAEEELRKKLEAGEISEAEYETLKPTTEEDRPHFIDPNKVDFLPGVIESLQNPAAQQAVEEPPKPQYQIDDSYWINQLEEKDINYLILKWGSVYTPQQWISMETMYNRYSKDYDLNTDREEVLKKMCKTSLKMDEALDIGDITGYKNLAMVFDQLRKSGKFTEAQNKDEKERTLDSIGELVALCEREGGIIDTLPQYDPDQYPQDKIDFTLKDLQSYTYRLVTNELGLGDLIESYVEKLEEAEENAVDVNEGLITSAEEKDNIVNSVEEADLDFQTAYEQDIEAEAERLLLELPGRDN